ncbi:hypothetical protein BDV26DRAFT_265048 [Aspergillus bertholletiae]|uniref:Uncharacterized protein n=1 Tax=Aspergillus bertholletiae TaxID=1226010 RepID=A0A5N7B3Y8_9EURO|nr:hypothetical protein BDV26DRAFT_265048 [Aspergillus bertholletiae]
MSALTRTPASDRCSKGLPQCKYDLSKWRSWNPRPLVDRPLYSPRNLLTSISFLFSFFSPLTFSTPVLVSQKSRIIEQ